MISEEYLHYCLNALIYFTLANQHANTSFRSAIYNGFYSVHN